MIEMRKDAMSGMRDEKKDAARTEVGGRELLLRPSLCSRSVIADLSQETGDCVPASCVLVEVERAKTQESNFVPFV